MDQVIEILRSLGPFSPLLVYFSATAETAGFVGLFVPGELLTIVGGASAGLGETPLLAVMAAAVGGAITGDSLGFWIGRRFGDALLDRPLLRRARPAFAKAGRFLEKNRRWSLVVGRFTPMIRSLLPMAAGASGMQYRVFAIPNAVGGALWGVAATSIGFWAGARWESIEETFRQGMWLFTALVVTIVAATYGVRWVANNPGRVRLTMARLGDRPVVGRFVRLLVSSWGEPRPYLRAIPHAVVLVATVAALSVTALVDLSFVEARIVSWLEGQISDDLEHGLAVATEVFGLPLLFGLALLVALATIGRPRGRLVAAATAISAGSALIVAGVTQRSVEWIPREWHIDGAEFPDLRSAVAVAVVLSIAWPWAQDWATGTRRLGLAMAVATTLVITSVGARLVYPFDAFAGMALGTVSIVLATAWLDSRVRNSLRVDPKDPQPSPVAQGAAPAAAHPTI